MVGGLRTLFRSMVYQVSMERGNKEKLGEFNAGWLDGNTMQPVAPTDS